jgi:hypothetical protein
MAIKQKKPILIPILGLDVSSPAEYIDNRATPNCQNMQISHNEISKRIGTSLLGANLGERILAGREFTVEGSKYVVRIGLTKVELLNISTNTWVDITGTALTGTDNDRVYTAIPILIDERVVVFTNGIDNIRKYTSLGNTSDLGGSPPKAKFVQEYGDYLLLAYVYDSGLDLPMRVQWCDTGNIEEWVSGNAGYVDILEDGQNITGLALYGSYLVVHKENSIYVGYPISSAEVFQFDRKSTEVGTICQATIQNLPTGEQIFLAKDGLHLFNGNTAPAIESSIQDELRTTINPVYINKCWSIVCVELDEYWLGVPTGSNTEVDTVYKFNYKTRQCYKDYRLNTTCAFTYTKNINISWDDEVGTWDEATGRWDDTTLSALSPIIIFGDKDGNTVQRYANYNDNGVAIDAWWESKEFEADEKGRLARWLGMRLWAKGSGITTDYSIDGGNTWVTIETSVLSGDYPSDSSPLKLYFDILSTKIRFRFRNNTIDENFTFKQFIPEYINRELT